METKERKKGFIGWVENIWFYHKWHILVGTLVIIFLGIGVVQCVSKEEPEVTVLFVGEADIGGDREALVEDFGYSVKDLNGNGKIDMSFAFFSLSDKESASKFNTEMLVGEHYIYIVNDDYFEKLLLANALVPVSEFLGHTPDYAEGGGYGIRLKYLDAAETRGFANIDRNSIICMRSNSENGADYKSSTELYKNNYNFFDALINYKTEAERQTVDLVYIGEQSFYKNTIYDFEYSVYKIGRLYDKKHIAILNYEEQKILSSDGGLAIFGEEEKAAAAELARGNKIMIVSPEVYAYLKEEGLLASFSKLGIEQGGDDELYGIKLSDLNREDATDLTEVPGFKYVNKDMYLCGSADIEGYTADILGYMRKWMEG